MYSKNLYVRLSEDDLKKTTTSWSISGLYVKGGFILKFGTDICKVILN